MGRRRVYSKINTLTHSKVMKQHNKKVVVSAKVTMEEFDGHN